MKYLLLLLYPLLFLNSCGYIWTCLLDQDPYPLEVKKDNPIGYWRLGESSGATASDKSGHGNDGTLTGGYILGQPGALAGVSDTAISFDNASSYMTCGSNGIPTAPPLTLEAWVYFNQDQPPGDFDYILQAAQWTGVGDLFAIARQAVTNKVYYVASSVVKAGPVMPTGQWNHIVLVFNTAAPFVQAYLNGVEQTITQPAAMVAPIGPACYMGRLTTATHYMNGRIDEVAIYATALSLPRIQAHYNAGATHAMNCQ